MNQKVYNHQQRIKEDAMRGVDKTIADRLNSSDANTATAIAKLRTDLVDNVVSNLLRHYTIRDRVRK